VGDQPNRRPVKRKKIQIKKKKTNTPRKGVVKEGPRRPFPAQPLRRGRGMGGKFSLRIHLGKEVPRVERKHI